MSELPTTQVFEISLSILTVNYLWTHGNRVMLPAQGRGSFLTAFQVTL